MVAHLPGLRQRRLFLREHREAADISAETMGRRIDMTRESVYRLEKEQSRINSVRMLQYAEVLGIEPEELWRRPGPRSIDALIADESDEFRVMAYDIVKRLLSRERRRLR